MQHQSLNQKSPKTIRHDLIMKGYIRPQQRAPGAVVAVRRTLDYKITVQPQHSPA